MSRFDRLLRIWCEAHPTRNPPAGEEDLRDLSKMIGADLPAEVAAFYKLCNGVPDYEYDAHIVCFWSIQRIQQERTEWPGARGLCFADVLLHSSGFEFFVENDEVLVWDGETGKSAGSFVDFLEAYVERPVTFPLL